MKKKNQKKLRKGMVLSEWQDGQGQWFRSVVARNTKAVLKIDTKRIDQPTHVQDEERPERD